MVRDNVNQCVNMLTPVITQLSQQSATCGAYSSPNFGMRIGASMDLTTGWDFKTEEHRKLAIEYVEKVIDRLHHPKSERPQYSPHSWTVPTYGKILQMAPNTNEK